jgi:NAD(P)-dependent dehydrogenase (short-subunit alcohol dehydrogenase family)
MIKQSKGKIISVGSGILKAPAGPFLLHYACSKGAIHALTQCLARALGPSGINVNALLPGFTASEATLGRAGSEKAFELTIKEQCIPRREEPADLVGTAVFLASKDSDFITGQLIIVDGGYWLI